MIRERLHSGSLSLFCSDGHRIAQKRVSASPQAALHHFPFSILNSPFLNPYFTFRQNALAVIHKLLKNISTFCHIDGIGVYGV